MDERKPQNRDAQGGVLDGKRKHDNTSAKRVERRTLGVYIFLGVESCETIRIAEEEAARREEEEEEAGTAPG